MDKKTCKECKKRTMVNISGGYIQTPSDESHWIYQCSECNLVRWEFHGEEKVVTYYSQGKDVK